MTQRYKYGAIKTEVYGQKFHSKAEAARYVVLRDMLLKGEIQNLQLQVPYLLCGGLFRYIADFVYHQGGKQVVEDVKGVRTQEYRMKAKMMKRDHGVTISEVKMNSTQVNLLLAGARR